MVYLGAYGAMRPEELAGLRRRDVDIDNLVIRVRVAEPERTNGKRAPGATKSDAGVRTVVLPGFLHKEVKQHLAWFADKGPDGLVFVGEKGAPSGGHPLAGSGSALALLSASLTASASTTFVTPGTLFRPARVPP